MMRKIIGIIFAFLISAALGEILVRSVGRLDEDGNFSVRGYRLFPYHLPVKRAREAVWRCLHEKNVRFAYDPLLGWVPKPGFRSADGRYSYGPAGIRIGSPKEPVTKAPLPGVLRIAIFGDSFVHGAGEDFRDTWGHQLEKLLELEGVRAEVLNFGMSGYGMDQAFLRWKKDGRSYAPDIVIFGLQLEGLQRNVNLNRFFYVFQERWLVFFKPRFILDEGRLQLINSPTPALEEVAGIIERFDSWKYSKYECFFDPAKYRESVFSRSRFFALGGTVLRSCWPNSVKRKARENRCALGFGIMRAFKEDVEGHGGRFCVVYLPCEKDLRLLARGRSHFLLDFLDTVDKTMPMIRPESAFLEARRRSELKRLIPEHYSTEGNRIIAQAVADHILQQRAGSGDGLLRAGSRMEK